MKSQKLLPLDKRDKANAKQLLEALILAEKELSEYDSQSTKIIYRSMKITVCEMAKEIEEMTITNKETNKKTIESDDKVFDRTIKFFDLVGDYDKTLEGLRKKINPDDADAIDKEVSMHPTLKFAKTA